MNLFLYCKACLFIIALGIASVSFAQQTTASYIIISKNDSVGTMQASQKASGDDIIYSVTSTVETKMLMTIKVDVQEEAHYHKEKLMASSSLRTINEKPKGNKQTKATGDGYSITDDGKEDHLSLKRIEYDFLRLYFTEPVAIGQVYSDYYQKMLSIKTVSPHIYQIDLPEVGSNIYYYENGICRKVDIRGALFNAQMILNR